MQIFRRISLVALVMSLAGCAAQQTHPIESVLLFGGQVQPARLIHVDDRRPADSKQTEGDGVDYIHYGDDKLTPRPVEVLDKEVGTHYGEKLHGNKVVVSKYTISLLPVIREEHPAYSMFGPSVVSVAMGMQPGGPTGESKYECDIKGFYEGRTWWVKNHVVVSGNGAQSDIEELLRKCNSVAISRLGDVIK